MTELAERRLDSIDVEERRQAVLMLRPPVRDGERAIGLILRAMQDPSWRVRKTAVDTLLEGYPVDSYIKGVISLLYIEDNAGARNASIECLVRLDKKATDSLMAAFDTPNADIRKFIIDIIGKFRDRKAIPLLVAALNDEDENVRAAAVEHLGDIREPSVVDSIIGILEGGDLWTAYPAADALGRIGDKRAVPALIRALDKRTLREPVLKALGKVAGEESLDSIAAFVADKSRAVGQEALLAIETIYRRGIPETAITDALRRAFGEDVIETLLVHAWSARSDVRSSAILMLGLLKDEMALAPLLELSADEEFAGDVKRALVFIGREKPEVLLPLFETDDAYIRRFLCSVAAGVAAPIYFDLMAGLIGDDDGHVRALAASTLAGIRDSRAIALILGLFRDPYEDVQEDAVKALAAFGGELDAGDILDGLKDGDPRVRRNTALLLGRMGVASSVPALGFALRDGDVTVRRAVVTALSSIRGVESVGHLHTALTDEDADIRSLAALSLGSMRGGSAFETLCLLLKDEDDLVKVSAAKAIGMLGDERAVSCLSESLSDPNGFVVTAAIDALGRLTGDESKRLLVGMLSSADREIRRSAIKALSCFPDADEYVLSFIRDADWATRVAVAEAVLGLRKEHVRRAVSEAYDEEEDPVVRKAFEKYLNA